MRDWIDLSPYWDEIRALATERENQKVKYFSSKNWSKYSTHFVGLCGEFVFSHITGISVDKSLNAKGDPGYDFIINNKTYSIKTTQYWRDPDLKEYLRPKKWCDFYILIGVDIDKKRGKIFGWANTNDIKNASFIDYGYGKQRAINHKDLRKLVKNFTTLETKDNGKLSF